MNVLCFKKRRFSFIQVAAISSFLAVVGCGGSSGDQKISIGPVDFQIGHAYVIDAFDEADPTGRVAAFPNFSLADWRTYTPATVPDAISPQAITFDNQGRMLIADTKNHRIIRMDDMAGLNKVSYGTDGAGAGQFHYPEGLAVDSNNRIYIADFTNQRIVRMDDMAGTNLVTLPDSGSVSISQPRSVALDSQGRLYILGINGGVVRVDNISGANPVNYFPTAEEALSNPIGLAIDNQDRIYICDSQNNRIVRINDITGAGRVAYGSLGSGKDKFRFPNAIAVNAAGQIFVSDSDNHRVIRIDNMTGAGWQKIGNSGYGDGQFVRPIGIAVRD